MINNSTRGTYRGRPRGQSYRGGRPARQGPANPYTFGAPNQAQAQGQKRTLDQMKEFSFGQQVGTGSGAFGTWYNQSMLPMQNYGTPTTGGERAKRKGQQILSEEWKKL